MLVPYPSTEMTGTAASTPGAGRFPTLAALAALLASARFDYVFEFAGAGEGNRTLVVSLGSFCSAIELHPRSPDHKRSAAAGPALGPVGPACGRVDRDGPHVRRQTDFEDLEVVRGADLVVAHAARDKARVAGFEPAAGAVLEFELDPALQRIDELALADVVVPAGRLGHAGERGRQLRPHPAVARRRHAEIAVFEETPPALDIVRRLGTGHSDFHRRLCTDRPVTQRRLDGHRGFSSRLSCR